MRRKQRTNHWTGCKVIEPRHPPYEFNSAYGIEPMCHTHIPRAWASLASNNSGAYVLADLVQVSSVQAHGKWRWACTQLQFVADDGVIFRWSNIVNVNEGRRIYKTLDGWLGLLCRTVPDEVRINVRLGPSVKLTRG